MDPLSITRLTGITSIDISLQDIVLRLAVAFILGVITAISYRKTHKAFAFSYSMVVAIILVSVIVCMVLMVIDRSLARAFGLVGALAIIRFRTPVKDIRDIVFLFLAVANGISTGAGAFNIALTGVIGANIIALVMYSVKFGSTAKSGNLLLKIIVDAVAARDENFSIDPILQKYCDSYELIEMQASGETPQEIIYSIQLGQENLLQTLINEVSSETGIQNVVVLSAVHNMDVQ